ESMKSLPSGAVPAVRQPLADDKSLLPFFTSERVIHAAGGVGVRNITSPIPENGTEKTWLTLFVSWGYG
ncbi:hypothetical protein HCM09_004897, partial [Salmonella enterica subsp. enterica]|nr:hypothetical protein [Salmonella enterica subsp. enterica serovar Kasenyi]